MTEDRYALELERAIFNWYYGGDNAAPEAVFNAVANGLNNDMQIIAFFAVRNIPFYNISAKRTPVREKQIKNKISDTTGHYSFSFSIISFKQVYRKVRLSFATIASTTFFEPTIISVFLALVTAV